MKKICAMGLLFSTLALGTPADWSPVDSETLQEFADTFKFGDFLREINENPAVCDTSNGHLSVVGLQMDKFYNTEEELPADMAADLGVEQTRRSIFTKKYDEDSPYQQVARHIGNALTRNCKFKGGTFGYHLSQHYVHEWNHKNTFATVDLDGNLTLIFTWYGPGNKTKVFKASFIWKK